MIPPGFVSFAAVEREHVVVKTSAYFTGIMIVVFNRKTSGCIVRFFSSLHDVEEFLDGII